MSLGSEDFTPISADERAAGRLIRPRVTYWRDAWRRFKRNRLALLGLILLAIMFVAAILGPALSTHSYGEQNYDVTNRPPGGEYWFGTDGLGRDLFIRVLSGARISLAIGIVSSVINLTIGVAYGAVSGFAGGRVDDIMMRIIDILYAIPVLLIVILLMVILGPGLRNIFIALGIGYWLTMARIVRGQILTIREQDYVLAARTIGVPRWRLIFKHLIPNVMGPIVVYATLSIPTAIFMEAFLSFIGLGVSAPVASWGTLASDGLGSMKSYPWQLFFPAAAISMCLLGFNFVGDGLRDALDPRFRT